MADKVDKSEAQWQQELTPAQFEVLRRKGTERAFTGALWDHKGSGTYVCAGCGQALFASKTKYDSGSGWPSFWEPIADGRVERHPDASHGMQRVEVVCGRCEGHLGHVFEDGPEPTGERFCINSASLAFRDDDEG